MRARHLLPLFALPLFALSCADLTSTAPAYVHESNELERSAGPAAMTNKTDTSESALVGRFRSIPDTHNGVMGFLLEFYFNEEPVGLSYKTVRDHLFDVTNGRVVKARRVTPGSNLEWELTVAPDSLDVIELTNRITASCEDDYAVCTADGKRLVGTATAQVQPLVPTTSLPLTATFADLPGSHDGATAFTFQLRFSEEPAVLSYVSVRDSLLNVTNGRITAARRVTRGSNLAFFVTVQPSAASDISLTVVGTTDCDRKYAVCTVDGRMLAGGTSATVDVVEPQPDLELGSSSVSDTSLATGGSFTLSATVSNAGDGASAATTLRYRRSEDATITSSDTQVGTDPVGALAPGGASDQSVDLTAPSTAGAYYYGACVDEVTGESDTTDNCSASVKVDIEDPSDEHFDIDLLFTSNVDSTTRAAIEAARDILEAIVWSTELADIQMPATVECGPVSVDDVGVVDDIAVLFDVRYNAYNSLARQRECYRTTEHDFPVFSSVTLDRDEIRTLTDEEFEHLVLHQLLHALGFNSTTLNNLDLVAIGRYDGYYYFIGDSAVAAWVLAGGTEYYDKVPLLPGATHWQVILFDNEIMSPLSVRGRQAILSAITLQALVDMGYTVDLGFAEAFEVPKNAYNQAQDGFPRILDMSNDVLRQPVTVLDRYGTPVRVIQPPPGTIRRLRPRQEVWHDSPQT